MAMATGGGVMNGATGQLRGYDHVRMPQMTPEQMQLFQQMFGRLGPDSALGKLASGDEGMFGQMEAPALKQFAGLQGNIASRFSGMGSGARRSSGFQNTSNQAAMDFAERLQSQRMGLQQQAIRDLFGMSNQLLGQRPYEDFFAPKQRPWWQEMLMGLSSGAGQALGSLPMLAAL